MDNACVNVKTVTIQDRIYEADGTWTSLGPCLGFRNPMIAWKRKLGRKLPVHRMQSLLETEDVYGVYEFHSLPMEAEGVAIAPEVTELVHPKLEQLLTRFDSLFQVPTSLPPHRMIDHRIHLLPNTKPVNVRSYRYPHYQKGEMEKLVNEMLEQRII
ncbi:hypothetical protein Tco_1497297 [Tanacetum coccineum]